MTICVAVAPPVLSPVSCLCCLRVKIFIEFNWFLAFWVFGLGIRDFGFRGPTQTR